MKYSTNLTKKLQIARGAAMMPEVGHDTPWTLQRIVATPGASRFEPLARLRQRFGTAGPSTWLFATQPEHALGYLMDDGQ